MRIPSEPLLPEIPEQENAALAAFLRRKKSHQDHSALVEAQNTYTGKMEEWMARAVAERPGGKAANVARDCVAFHARAVDAAMTESAMGKTAGDAFRVWAGARGKAFCLRMAAFEDAERHSHALDQHDLRREAVFRAAAAEPESFTDCLGQLAEIHVLSVGQGLFPASAARARLEADRDLLRETAFESLYGRGPERAVAAMGDLGFDASRRARERRRLEGDLRAAALTAEAARSDAVRVLADTVDGVIQEASLRGESGDLRALSTRFAELGEEGTAGELARRADHVETHAALIKESAAMNMPDLAAKIRGVARAAHAAGNGDLKRILETELDARRTVYRLREAAFAEDPAGAVAAAVEAAGAAQTEEETAAFRLAAQERNGVPETARRILTGAEKTFLLRLAAELEKAPEAERQAALEEFRDRLGRYAGRALGELFASHDDAKGDAAA